MDLYGPPTMRAWANGTLAELAASEPVDIARKLAGHAADRRLAPNPESMSSWTDSVAVLKRATAEVLAVQPAASSWHYFLEFEVPRRSRRVDTLIVAGDVIFLIEWKVGASRYDRAALWQAEQYALDLRDFHEGSRDRYIIPILVATEAEDSAIVGEFDSLRPVQEVQRASPGQLADLMCRWWLVAHDETRSSLNPLEWEDSPYRPTPTIVEAAGMLYERNDVRELSLSGAENLDQTVASVLELIDRCKREGRRGIAFITGAPGSGKTLAGLQVVHSPELLQGSEAAGVFLSGNMPLVNVISASLVDSSVRSGRKKVEAEREVKTFIQHAYAFRNEYAESPERWPSEHVILFDEAQRAWDGEQVRRWTRGQSSRSEPQIFLDVMNRVPDWGVVIALVGSGQEINRGEAGLGEWGRAMATSHSDWLVSASPAVLPGQEAPPGGRLFDELPQGVDIAVDPRLNLRMNVRSPRAERLNTWVDRSLVLRLEDARAVFPDPREFPLVLTRSLDSASEWLRDHRSIDADQRTGFLMSADARRLRAWGFDLTLRREKKWADWFLKPVGDVRGSDQLEIAATNFDCQGLELDWAGVLWGNDLVPDKLFTGLEARQFKGTKWQKANAERSKYIVNGYRVILTRARRGQIICVPEPDGRDKTLPPEEFDRIAEMLQRAGVPSID